MVERGSKFDVPLIEIAQEISGGATSEDLYTEFKYPLTEQNDLETSVRTCARLINNTMEDPFSSPQESLLLEVVDQLKDWDEPEAFVAVFILEDKDCVKDLPETTKRMLLDMAIETTVLTALTQLLTDHYLGSFLASTDRGYYELKYAKGKEWQKRLRQQPQPKSPFYLK